MRRAQAAYRIGHGKVPTTLPLEQGGMQVDKLKALFVGKDSQKAPIFGMLAAAYGLAALLGYNLPGVPALTQEAAMTTFTTGIATVFLAFRIKKSGPTS